MADDLSYTSSSQNGLDDDERESDILSISSDVSELSAARLATHPEHAVIWELLQGCQEAAVEDIPDRYHECVSIFDVRKCDLEPVAPCQNYDNDSEYYGEVFRITGAIESSEPWSLPSITRPLSEEDALWPPNLRVMNVAEVIPTAAVYVTPGPSLAERFQHLVNVAISPDTTGDAMNSLNSASPKSKVHKPLFASAALTSASQIAHRVEKPSFHTLWKYNRLATTSLLRQVHSFCIDVPVVGILLRGSQVAFHIDWYEDHKGTVDINSAFYTSDAAVDLKIWDMRDSIEGAELRAIFSKLRAYTAGTYAAQVLDGIKGVPGRIQSWKWDPSLLPEISAYTRLQRHIEEPPGEKIMRWQESMETSVDDTVRTAWLRKNLWARKKESRIVYGGLSRDFLSPPSTPQSPESVP